MALIKCGECGREISTTAENCPYCGSKTSHGKNLAEARGCLVGWVFAVIALMVGVFLMAANLATYTDCVEYLDYYEYFSDTEKGAMQAFGIGLLLAIAGFIDMCCLGYKAWQLKNQDEYISYASNPVNQWRCTKCAHDNHPSAVNCAFCDEPRKSAPAVSTEKIPTWKRIQMEEEKQRLNPTENKQSKCLFCGAAMAEGQMFCGACGRRKD